MADPTSKPNRSRLASPFLRILLGSAGAVFLAYLLFIHPFLAVTQRVDAEILVVEGWIPTYMLPAAAKEFEQGKYIVLMVSGIQEIPASSQSDTGSPAQTTASQLEQAGIPHRLLVPCTAPFARWMRTNKSARAVREKIIELGLKPRGINVVTAGPHARETWTAYRHAFGATTPVGIISIPKTNYPANRWWLTGQGWLWVSKDFVAWIKEAALGQRT